MKNQLTIAKLMDIIDTSGLNFPSYITNFSEQDLRKLIMQQWTLLQLQNVFGK